MQDLTPIRGTDIVVIIALLVAAVAFIPFMRAQSRDTVLVYKGADVIAEYPLDEDKIFHLDGVDGSLEIEIKDEQVRVRSAPCRNQICVKMVGYQNLMSKSSARRILFLSSLSLNVKKRR